MEFITPIAGYWATWGDSGRFLRCRWVMHAALHKNCQWFTCVRCWPRGHQGVNSRSQADEQKRKKRKNEKKIEGRWKLNLKPGWGHTFSVALQLCKITVNAVDLTFVNWKTNGKRARDTHERQSTEIKYEMLAINEQQKKNPGSCGKMKQKKNELAPWPADTRRLWLQLGDHWAWPRPSDFCRSLQL